jgi:hypothetical protein
VARPIVLRQPIGDGIPQTRDVVCISRRRKFDRSQLCHRNV